MIVGAACGGVLGGVMAYVILRHCWWWRTVHVHMKTTACGCESSGRREMG